MNYVTDENTTNSQNEQPKILKIQTNKLQFIQSLDQTSLEWRRKKLNERIKQNKIAFSKFEYSPKKDTPSHSSINYLLIQSECKIINLPNNFASPKNEDSSSININTSSLSLHNMITLAMTPKNNFQLTRKNTKKNTNFTDYTYNSTAKSVFKKIVNKSSSYNKSSINSTKVLNGDPYLTLYNTTYTPVPLIEIKLEKINKFKNKIEFRKICIEEEIYPIIHREQSSDEIKESKAKKRMKKLIELIEKNNEFNELHQLTKTNLIKKIRIKQERLVRLPLLIANESIKPKDDLEEYNNKILSRVQGRISDIGYKDLRENLRKNHELSNILIKGSHIKKKQTEIN